MSPDLINSLPELLLRSMAGDKNNFSAIPGMLHKDECGSSVHRFLNKLKRPKNNFMESIASDFNKKRDKRNK